MLNVLSALDVEYVTVLLKKIRSCEQAKLINHGPSHSVIAKYRLVLVLEM